MVKRVKSVARAWTRCDIVLSAKASVFTAASKRWWDGVCQIVDEVHVPADIKTLSEIVRSISGEGKKQGVQVKMLADTNYLQGQTATKVFAGKHLQGI